MNKDSKSISFFNTIVVRTAASCIENFNSSFEYDKFLENKRFAVALKHANPTVYNEAKDRVNGKIMSDKEVRRLNRTLYNYWHRIHLKTVPFGLFTNISTAIWSENASCLLNNSTFDVKLDMEILHNLRNQIVADPLVLKHLSYITNNTLYQIDKKIRYNEVSYHAEKIEYKLSAIESNEIIDSILDFSKTSKSFLEITTHLTSFGFSMEEVIPFVEQLINEQLLLATFQVNISGIPALSHLIYQLEGIDTEACPRANYWLKLMLDIENELIKIKNQLGDTKYDTKNLVGLISNHLSHIDDKKLVHIDCLASDITATLPKDLQDELMGAVCIMKAYTRETHVSNLKNFAEAFYQKYEDAFVPLMEAIDNDTGVGYGQFLFKNENIFLNGVSIEQQRTTEAVPQLDSDNLSLFWRKWMESITQGGGPIIFTKDDIEKLNINIEELATTFQIVFSPVDSENKIYYIQTAGNACAANLVSRFASSLETLKNEMENIAQFEMEKYHPAIVAEIVHIPAYRTGNITFRPLFRDYEIPVYINSTSPKQIDLSDLFVGIRNNRIVLYSKSLGKEIIPKLTNAHNYGKDTLPVYQFLCDLNYQSFTPSAQFEWPDSMHFMGQYPRIQYNNIIIKKATWVFTHKQIEPLYASRLKLNHNIISVFLSENNIPKHCSYQLLDEEHQLYWENLDMVLNFLNDTPKMQQIVIYESISKKGETFVKDKNGNHYTTEFIAMAKNINRTNKVCTDKIILNTNSTTRNFLPGDEWIYFKIYVPYTQLIKTITHISTYLNSELTFENSLFFFLPFKDPEFHIRLRIKIIDTHLKRQVLDNLLYIIKNEINVSKLVIDTYQRELERYGNENIDFVEQIFCTDSIYVANLHYLNGLINKSSFPLMVMHDIDTILTSMQFNLQDKMNFCASVAYGYAIEFNVKKGNELYQLIQQSIQENRAVINQILEESLPESLFDTLEHFHYALQLVANFRSELNEICKKHKNQLNSNPENHQIIQSIVHMHCIRCFYLKPRENELFIYNALSQYYKSKFHRENPGVTKKKIPVI